MGGVLVRTAGIAFVFAGLAALGLVVLVLLAAGEGRAGAPWLNGLQDSAPAPIATPVRTFKDCQEIARCTGCRPVYKCRSCKYQRVCARGFCEWRDVCVWGPAVKVLPPNARIIRIR